MQRNSIKIVSNQEAKTISYYIKNEAGEWIHVDNSSPLSRKEYTETSIYESAEKVIEIIDEIYNTGNRGVDLEISCTNDEFIYLSSLVKEKYSDDNISATKKETTRQSKSDRLHKKNGKSSKNGEKEKIYQDMQGKESTYAYGNGNKTRIHPTSVLINSEENEQKEESEQKEENSNILCRQSKMQVAFAGKISSGKTTLIDALAELNHVKFSVSHESGYTLCQNAEGSQLWYEVAGIDIGKINVEKTYTTIKSLIEEGVEILVYCLSTNKIELAEEDILLNIKSNFPNVRILAVLTSCVDDDGDIYAERISDLLNGIKVLPVLAKDKKIKNGVISAYGLEDISRFIYGGK